MTRPTFSVDETYGPGLVRLLRDLNLYAVTYRDGLGIEAGDRDVDWIPKVAERRWIAVTADKRLRRRLVELEAIQNARLGLVVIATRLSTEDNAFQKRGPQLFQGLVAQRHDCLVRQLGNHGAFALGHVLAHRLTVFDMAYRQRKSPACPSFRRSRNASSAEVLPVCRGACSTKYLSSRIRPSTSSRSIRDSGAIW